MQAAAWLVRLDADDSAAALAQWRRWQSEDARHRAAFLRLQASWRHADCLKNLRPLDGTVNVRVLDTFPGVSPFREAWSPRLRREVLYLTLGAALALTTLLLAAWLADPEAFVTALRHVFAIRAFPAPPHDSGAEVIRLLASQPRPDPH